MKKLFLGVLAIAGLVACVQEDVLGTQNLQNEIGFSGYVGKQVRSDADPSMTLNDLNHFHVWAYVASSDGNVLENEEVWKNGDAWTYLNTQYWVKGHTYHFFALANADENVVIENLNGNKLTNNPYDNGVGEISFTNNDGTQDVLYSSHVVETVENHSETVAFDFDHILSKVKFTFKNGFATDNINLVVTDIKMTAPEKATTTLAFSDPVQGYVWADHTGTTTLAFGDAAGAARIAANANGASDKARLTIPAGADKEYTVTFKVEQYVGNVNLNASAPVQLTSTIKGVTFEAGTAYNFVATITPESLDLKEIVFAEPTIDEWDNDEINLGEVGNTEVHVVYSAEQLQAAVESAQDVTIVLQNDIDLADLTRAVADVTLTVKSGKKLTLDLNGHTLSATSTQKGKNYDMIDVRGNLTVKNGTINYTHEGENMGWNSSTSIFNITAGGVVNLYGVTAKNNGGSDMGFVAHLNNWGEVTLNAENCVLESNYVAVRVFNSGYDKNNVAIHNSTLKGDSNAFWVHNYTAADFGSEAKAEAQKALLNLDIFDGTNTFVGSKPGAPLRYGMTNALYFGLVKDEASLAEILAAGWSVILANDIVLEKPLKLANEKNTVINLNGHTISATESATGSYGLITNQGKLNVVGPGKLQLTATVNRGWNAYSSVISNTVGGNLVVEGGVVIEHLGGTDMAYGIDNLTNGKATSAVVTVKDATVKSPYRAIRQFLNGIEATNELHVKAGAVVEGANKSIWMQDPSKNANTGKLVVEAGAQLKGDVYLYVCAGSTTWPVEVSLASAALVGESKVLTGNVPAQYEVVEVDGVWVVKEIEGTVVTSVDELTAALANDAVSTIILGNANFGTIVAASNKLIHGSPYATVESVNLNGADNLTLKNIVFDAATAKLGYDYKGVAKLYANIYTGDKTNNSIKGAHNLVIDGCTFEGTFANGGAAIEFADYYRKSGFSGNITIKNCTFNTVGSYYDIYGYYTGDSSNGHGNFVIENNVFKSTRTQGGPVYLGRYASNVPVVVKGNAFEAVTSLEDAVYVQDHSNYGISINASNNTFAN